MSDEITYDLERDGVVIATDLEGPPFLDEALDPSTTYTYRIRAKNKWGVGPWSDPAQFTTAEIPPLTAGTLSLDSLTRDTATITYHTPSGGFGGLSPVTHTLQRFFTGLGDWVDQGTIVPDEPFPFDHSNVNPGTTIELRVRTEDNDNNTEFSNELGYEIPDEPELELEILSDTGLLTPFTVGAFGQINWAEYVERMPDGYKAEFTESSGGTVTIDPPFPGARFRTGHGGADEDYLERIDTDNSDEDQLTLTVSYVPQPTVGDAELSVTLRSRHFKEIDGRPNYRQVEVTLQKTGEDVPDLQPGEHTDLNVQDDPGPGMAAPYSEDEVNSDPMITVRPHSSAFTDPGNFVVRVRRPE